MLRENDHRDRNNPLCELLSSLTLRLAIVLLLAGAVASAQNPLAGDAKAAKAGEYEFRINCALCHGLGARGGGRGPDLTRAVRRHAHDADMFQVLPQPVDYLNRLWSNKLAMKEVAISEFKAKCLAMLDEVQKTQQPILVTRRGKAVAEVNPPSPKNDRSWIGSMKQMEILGDIISPASDEDDWEALRD